MAEEGSANMDIEGPKIKVTLRETYHYFRSISELKDCKHGGYLEGTIQIYGNSSRIKTIQLQLVPSDDDFSTKQASSMRATNNTYDVDSLLRNLHCNLLYISTKSLKQTPDITESGWRINLQRKCDTMILSRENHPYVEEDLDSEVFWEESESKLILGPHGLRVTIVKPLSKEDKSSRPGIYVNDVLGKRFEESLVTKYSPSSEELDDEKEKFYESNFELLKTIHL